MKTNKIDKPEEDIVISLTKLEARNLLLDLKYEAKHHRATTMILMEKLAEVLKNA